MRTLALFFIAVMLFSVTVQAQEKGALKGKLVDSVSKQALSLATITVFRARDTVIVTYRLSDPQGEFRVPGLVPGVLYRVLVTFSGYRTWRKEFQLTAGQVLDLGSVALGTDAASLDEVIVTAERPPVIIKKDTIEFNAAAFKTLPTALVEDLLKKLPGVDVDKDGNITVNGRAVNRILVDGKEFFGGDPAVATRNLPANIVDKVQVVDDKDQLNRDPDIPRGQLGQIINLKLKKSIKQGWFGKAYAGAGTDNRHEAGAITNLFKDTLQISLLGYTNNLNRAGFSVKEAASIGGFQRSGMNSISIYSDGGASINGISLGGTGQGIQRSTGAGINISNEFGKDLTANLQYFYGHINSRLEQLSNTQQFIKDTILTIRNVTRQVADEYNHRWATSIRWHPDPTTTVLFRPAVGLSVNNSGRFFTTGTTSNYKPAINETRNTETVGKRSPGYTHELSYNRNFTKKGRSLYIANNIGFYNANKDQYNDIDNVFYNEPTVASSVNQLRRRNQPGLTTSLNINYSEPLLPKFTLRLSQLTEYFRNEDNLFTYVQDTVTGLYNVLNENLSNTLTRTGWRNTATAGLRWVIKNVTIGPDANAQWLAIDNRFMKNAAIRQHFFYVFPSLNVTWKELNISYRANAEEPAAADLQPVIDNTNSLYLQLGNPSLKPTVAHNLFINYNKYLPKNAMNINIYVGGSFNENSIIRARTIDDKGVQVTQPVNVDGTNRLYGNVIIGRQFKFNKNWQLSLRGSLNGSYSKNIILVNGNRSNTFSRMIGPGINGNFNWRDKIELTQRYVVNRSHNRYDNPAYTDLDITTHYTSSEIVIRVPKHWVWENSIDYSYNPQVPQGIRKTNVRWNAAVNFLFLKEDKGQLKLSVYDLLNQNISVSRSVRENFIQDNQTTVLRRYFLLTFTYNIRNLGGGKVGGRETFFMFR